jgi:hypothetical protein
MLSDGARIIGNNQRDKGFCDHADRCPGHGHSYGCRTLALVGHVHALWSRIYRYIHVPSTRVLATVVVTIAARADWRGGVRQDPQAGLPTIWTRVFPSRVLVGAAFGLFVVNGVHTPRVGSYTRFAKRPFGMLLCPVPDGDLLLGDECEAARPDFKTCVDHAWACQKTHAATQLAERNAADRAFFSAVSTGYANGVDMFG